MPAVDTLLELCTERRALRTRTDKGHIAFNNVPELRNLIHASLAHNFAEGRNARIVALSLSTMQLCLAYAYGDGGELSSQYTASAVSRVLYNMPVNYYFALDMDGVGALADAIGGVSLTPTQSVPNTNIVEGEPTVLFGSNALKYVQWRDTSVLTSSLDRQARQSQFVETFCKQALSSAQGNVGTLVNLYTTASNYAVTNLGLNEFSYLASSVLATGITSVDMTTLQGTMQQGDKFAEFYLDKTNVYETVLNVYYHEVGSEE